MKKIVANFIAVQLSERDVEQLGILFKKIDTNHDGYLSYDEIKVALENQK